jgi:hypothetical protein
MDMRLGCITVGMDFESKEEIRPLLFLLELGGQVSFGALSCVV